MDGVPSSLYCQRNTLTFWMIHLFIFCWELYEKIDIILLYAHHLWSWSQKQLAYSAQRLDAGANKQPRLCIYVKCLSDRRQNSHLSNHNRSNHYMPDLLLPCSDKLHKPSPGFSFYPEWMLCECYRFSDSSQKDTIAFVLRSGHSLTPLYHEQNY